MRATDFITEALVTPYKSEVLQLSKAMELLNSKCSDAVKMLEKPLWRGMNDQNADIFFADPSTGTRKSENTSNYYTLLMDTSPYMNGWPKRSASFICSTNEFYASNYARDHEIYAIFPFDGVKIAVCPDKDIWYTDVYIPEFDLSFRSDFNNMKIFNQWLKKLGVVASLSGLATAHEKPKVIALCKKHKVDPKTFIPILHAALSPERTKFKLLTIDQYVATNLTNNECWVGGPVVAIKAPLYLQFLRAYRQRQL